VRHAFAASTLTGTCSKRGCVPFHAHGDAAASDEREHESEAESGHENGETSSHESSFHEGFDMGGERQVF
jgi:hypothetical protein